MKTETILSDIPSLCAVLDSIQVNIFLADRNFNLVYMNVKAGKTIKGIENEIYKVFNIKFCDFIGGSIHRFHRDSDQVERILKNSAALPHEAKFDFGNIHLKSSINCIIGLEGEIVGYIVNWEDQSGEVMETEKMMKLVEELELIENYSNKF